MDRYLFIQNLLLFMGLVFVLIVIYMQDQIEQLVKENEELRRGVGDD